MKLSKREIESFIQMAKQFPNMSVKDLAISWGRSEKTVRKYLKKYGLERR